MQVSEPTLTRKPSLDVTPTTLAISLANCGDDLACHVDCVFVLFVYVTVYRA